jgi:uncharacterized RDD family membrane protein YckC
MNFSLLKKRCFAFFTDMTLIISFQWVITLIFEKSILAWTENHFITIDETGLKASVTFFTLCSYPLFYGLYHYLCTTTFHQITLGHYLFNLKLAPEKSLNLTNYLKRSTAQALEILSCGIFFLVPLLRRDHLTMADLWSGLTLEEITLQKDNELLTYDNAA